jgi:hypothetical protein
VSTFRDKSSVSSLDIFPVVRVSPPPCGCEDLAAQ